MNTNKSLPKEDLAILSLLAQSDERLSFEDIIRQSELSQARVSAVCEHRSKSGHIETRDEPFAEYRKSSKSDQSLHEGQLPDRLIAAALKSGPLDIPSLATASGVGSKLIGKSLRWLKQKKWVSQAGRTLELTALGTKQADLPYGSSPDEALIALLGDHAATEAEVAAKGVDIAAAWQAIDGRGIIDKKDRRSRFAKITDAGRALLDGAMAATETINQLKPEHLKEGAWRSLSFRPYDVALATDASFVATEHPLTSLFNETRQVFLEMGFEEDTSSWVESAFWDFDALFQPQDHPARDMQDTFYIKHPGRADISRSEDVIAKVKATHESGGDSGSAGWDYQWSREMAEGTVLRTHNTATSIRRLAAQPNPSYKSFALGPVFRRETIDYKHLPVFPQVDGIIVDQDGSFAMLLGVLKTFYEKMGFSQFQFRPAFFPYTEPSVEIFVWSDKKKDWIEMGGAGVFRPEVTQPLGCDVPVIAWGLGLERLAMFRFGLSNITELYRGRLSWLKSVSLKERYKCLS